MWTTQITNRRNSPIAVNDRTIHPQESATLEYNPAGITVFAEPHGTVSFTEPASGDYRKEVGQTWAVRVMSGAYAAYWGYEGGPVLPVEIHEDGSFAYGDLRRRIPIGSGPVPFLLGAFPSDAAEKDYIAARFSALLQGTQEERAAQLDAIARANDHCLPNLERPEALADPDGIARTTLAGHLIQFPLIDGETVVSAEVGVLAENPSAPFLNVVTSRADLFLPLSDCEVADGVLRRRAQQGPPRTPARRAAAFLPEPVTSAAFAIGKQLLLALGAEAWNQFKTQVLGLDGIPAYYDKIIGRIRAIVVEQFDHEHVLAMRQCAVKFDTYMQDYQQHKDMADPRLAHEDLRNALAECTNLLSAAGVFNDDRPSIANAFFYADACMMRILVRQEDYRRTARPEDRTAIRNDIVRMARTYADNVQRRHDAYIKYRMGLISEAPFYSWHITTHSGYRTIGDVSEGHHIAIIVNDRIAVDPRGSVPSFINTMRFEDKGNDFWWTMVWNHWLEISMRPDGGRGTNWRLANAENQKYRAAIEKATRSQLSELLLAKAQLESLVQQPIPL